MALVSLQIIDGVDKGRSFLNLNTPITIGREEGNSVRLNDERISRFHIKIQEDNGEIVLTDLDSTNGTRVNGETVQLRILRPGDRINVGRSTLVCGTAEEIAASFDMADDSGEVNRRTMMGEEGSEELATALPADGEPIDVLRRQPPLCPKHLSPAQAAQLSEIFDFLHRSIGDALDGVQIPYRANEAILPIDSWHRIQALQIFLARYARQIAEPGDFLESL